MGTAITIGEGILFVGTAVAGGILGAIGLTNAVNNGGSSCAITYTYAKPQAEAYPVDSSGLTLITASTTASSNTIGIRSPLELNTSSTSLDNTTLEFAREKGENEVTREIKERMHAGESLTGVLSDLSKKARAIPDKKERNERLGKIDQARKFLGDKNQGKREEQR